MNTDAAVDSVGGRVGSGIIIRDSEGNVLASSSQKIMSGYTPQIAEAVAYLRGLVLAREAGLRPWEVELDAQTVVKLVSSLTVPCSEVGLVIKDIKLHLLNFPDSKISFVPMEANKAAHHLAKLGLLVEDVNVWLEECPPSVAPFVLGDRPNLM
ncbi:hypothetical protein Dsin_023557 [Dipteronia sinensis]|uniref:RNase H type-1 domain-containing protein n=1 Tax=Dipteronia sinensis TaxID=43782 RepID=A0AAE0E273_9ROSI|nr:hypothetical protein Dsin_023557 [Dipteronia sinensis]